MSRLNGYPFWYYLVGVFIVSATVGLGSAFARSTGVDGWLGTLIWCVSLVVGFGIARRVNARLFKAAADPD
ncbi:MAG: hypothetical protein JWR52_2996 [Marmoricola sp.]|nr:hypothetical protein [Marmoricola sp.]